VQQERQNSDAQSCEAIEKAFDAADYTEVIGLMNEGFGESTYSLRHLFRDEQHKVMRRVLSPTLAAVDEQYRQIYEQHAGLVRYLASLTLPVPRRLLTPANFVINANFRAAAEAEPPDTVRMRALAEEARQVGINLDQLTLSWVLGKTLVRVSRQLAESPRDLDNLRRLEDLAMLIAQLPFEVNMAHAQNTFWAMLQNLRHRMKDDAAGGDEAAREWLEAFAALGNALRVRVND
jgi:hypothetical protein